MRLKSFHNVVGGKTHSVKGDLIVNCGLAGYLVHRLTVGKGRLGTTVAWEVGVWHVQETKNQKSAKGLRDFETTYCQCQAIQ